MAHINVENVSLTYPLYTKTSTSESIVSIPSDKRLITDDKGRILGLKALTNISFDLSNGDKLGIVGKNGAGKSTLLRLLSGLITPDSGQITLDGKCTNLVNLGLGIQPEASGHDNITLNALANGATKAEIEEKRSEIIEFSELGHFLDMPVKTYSSGMKMRLSFAVATSFNPEILILDEWLSTGDRSFRQKAMDRMQEFVSRAGILVLASHDLPLLQTRCNKGLWLENGQVKAFDNIKNVLEEYQKNSISPA